MGVKAPALWPVVIVGAGPTGATAAIELGLRGIQCLVLDRWTDVYPQPRAVHLDDELYRALARLGVEKQFAAISRPGGGLRLVDRRLRVLGEFSRERNSVANGYPRANMFDQPDLESMLRDRLHEQKSVTFRGGVDVTGVEQRGPGRVVVQLRDSTTGELESVEAEVVLGCDGANSLVRDAIGSSMQNLGFHQRWLVLDVATNADLHHWDGVHQMCDSTRAATYMRIGDVRYRWEFQLLDDETTDHFGTLNLLEPLLHPWLGTVDLDELELVRVAEYTFRAAIADRWRDGRIFLLGDAAHLTPPFIGQGMGAGVRDAVNLAWKIDGFLSGSLTSDVLDSYEPERSAHARALIRLATNLGTVMTRGGRLGDAMRGRIVPALNRLPFVQEQVSDSTTPALTGSEWIADDHRDRLAGRLCPNPVVGGSQRLDEVVGTGWAVITLEAPAPSDAASLSSRGCAILQARPGDELAAWLGEGRATAALIRPDRTVLASSAGVNTLCSTVTGLLAPRPVTFSHDHRRAAAPR